MELLVIDDKLVCCTVHVELQWLEHLWNHEKMFEAEVVRANECLECIAPVKEA